MSTPQEPTRSVEIERTYDADAEDVSQKVMVKVFNAIRRYDTERGFKPWLRTIWERTIIDECRKKQERPTAPDSALWDLLRVPDMTNEMIEEEVTVKARDLVQQQVKPAHWAIYKAHDIDGEENSALAARLGLSHSNVGTICLRVRQRVAAMKKLLSEE